MFDVILLPNDCDRELYQMICEAAEKQNMGPVTFQRETLCEMLNIPKNHLAETQFLLIHQVLAERSTHLNIPTRHVLRNYLREYFDLPLLKKQKKNMKEKWAPLTPDEKRFRVLGFLLKVGAATERDIGEALGESAHETLRHNEHYFEYFRVPYDDHRYWWRVTKWGSQDYRKIAGVIKTVRESKVESTRSELKKMREDAIKEMIELEKKILNG